MLRKTLSLRKGIQLVPAALAIIIALGQIWTHKTQTLSPWKAGGFGMYTTLHPADRIVWAETRNGALHVVGPSGLAEFYETIKPAAIEATCPITNVEFRFQVFPSPSRAEQLTTCLTLSKETSRMLVYEIRTDLWSTKVERVQIY